MNNSSTSGETIIEWVKTLSKAAHFGKTGPAQWHGNELDQDLDQINFPAFEYFSQSMSKAGPILAQNPGLPGCWIWTAPGS